MNEKLKTNLQNAARKTLQGFDKGLQFVQKHPVAFERTILVGGTFFVTRKAYKSFVPKNAAIEKAELAELAQVFHLDKPLTILRSLTPAPAQQFNVSELFHLEFSDVDVEDMRFGMFGMLFDLKQEGFNDMPLAVVPYEYLKPILEQVGAPLNDAGEKLLGF